MDLQNARRNLLGCSFLLIGLPLLYLLVVGPPRDADAESASRTIWEAVGGGGGGPPDDRQLFLDGGGAVQVPAGWELADPFTDRTPYWQTHTLFSQARRRPNSRRMLLRSPVEEESQIFLIAGAAADWLPELSTRLSQRRTHPLQSRWQERKIRTADGVLLEVTVSGIGRGLLSGDATVQVTAVASRDNRILVIDAGGAARTFSVRQTLDVLRSLQAWPLLAAPFRGNAAAPG